MAEPDKKFELADQMTGAGCLVRLLWMVLGNGVLVLCIGFVATHQGSFLSAADAVFWGMVPVLICLRHVDVTRMKGTTVFAQPATLSHWKRYSCLLVVLSLVAWAAAHAFAWFRG